MGANSARASMRLSSDSPAKLAASVSDSQVTSVSGCPASSSHSLTNMWSWWRCRPGGVAVSARVHLDDPPGGRAGLVREPLGQRPGWRWQEPGPAA